MIKKQKIVIEGLAALIVILAIVLYFVLTSGDVEDTDTLANDNQTMDQAITNDNGNTSINNNGYSNGDATDSNATGTIESSGISPVEEQDTRSYADIPVEELFAHPEKYPKLDNVLDRDKLTEAADTFVAAYFNLKDPVARKTKLGDIIDVDYVNQTGTSNMIYMDYVANDARGYAVDSSYDYGEYRVTGIDNASIGNGVVRIEVDMSQGLALDQEDTGGSEGGGVYNNNFTVVYQVYVSDNYKIKDIKYVKTIQR